MDNSGIEVSVQEMVDELLNRNAQLTMELAAKDIIIRKLTQIGAENGVTSGE